MSNLIANLGQGSDISGQVTETFKGSQVYVRYRPNIDDYSDIIQDALDNNSRVVIGTNRNEEFIINKPLDLNTRNNIEINGTLKIADGGSYALLANANAGTNSVQITNATDYFEAGQQVTVSDDNQTVQGGGAGHTRRRGNTMTVLSVVGTTITFTANLWDNFTTAANAKIGHTQSIFRADSVNDITIEGRGILDQNKANQYDVEPYTNGAGEDVTAGCCLTFTSCDRVKIYNVKLQNALLHNLHMKYCDDLFIDGVILYAAHDKNIIMWHCDGGEINNVRTTDADYEDGLIFYYNVDNIRISNLYSYNNGRFGICISELSHNIQMLNIYLNDNGVNLALNACNDIEINNANIYGGGLFRHEATIRRSVYVYGDSYNIDFNNLRVYECLDGHQNIAILGDCTNISFTGGGSYDTAGSGNTGSALSLDLGDGNYPSNITLNGFFIKNCKVAQIVNILCSDITFTGCHFVSNTDNGTPRDNTTFINCIGIKVWDSGQLTIPAAATQVFGSADLDITPDKQRFRLWFSEDGGGNAVKLYCDWTAAVAFPGNNFRVRSDVVPGGDIVINWEYDHNIRI